MNESSLQLTLREMLAADQPSPWHRTSIRDLSGRLEQVAELFYLYGDALADETAEHMGVSPAEVWLEVIFPSVWGILSTRQGILDSCSKYRAQRRASVMILSTRQGILDSCGIDGRLEDVTPNLNPSQVTTFAGRPAVRVLPSNWLEKLLLPEFSGWVLLRAEQDSAPRSGKPALAHETRLNPAPATQNGLVLALMPFNLASIGALDVIHLLCSQKQRVIAKVSEKVEFAGPHLEKIFEPFLQTNALRFVYGGPEVGAWLTARPEFSQIHLTGSARTAAAVEAAAGRDKVTSELGGVTAAIVFPDALAGASHRRAVARQVAFGALANNGQHCVSFQVVLVPESKAQSFANALWREMTWAAERPPGQNGRREVIDIAAAKRMESLVASLVAGGARPLPECPRAHENQFPVCLIHRIDQTMRLFREEAFGPIVGLLPLPDADFPRQALALANSEHLSGDLGISLFTSAPESAGMQQLAATLRHGIVTINTYPGVAFATSVPWGAGARGLSGRGWVHNYGLLPERRIEKVILSTVLGRKGFGPLRWEDPWLLNVTNINSLNLGKALVRTALEYFQKNYVGLFSAQMSLVAAIVRREWAARALDRKSPVV